MAGHEAASVVEPERLADERFEALVSQYGHLISAAIRRVGGARVAADHDDIAQAVRVALWRRLADEQSIDHPASYVYKAAIRETVRAVARLQARRPRSSTAARARPRCSSGVTTS